MSLNGLLKGFFKKSCELSRLSSFKPSAQTGRRTGSRTVAHIFVDYRPTEGSPVIQAVSDVGFPCIFEVVPVVWTV